MKNVMNLLALALALAGAVYLMLGPMGAILSDRPLAVLGLGLIGLGAIRHVRRATAATRC